MGATVRGVNHGSTGLSTYRREAVQREDLGSCTEIDEMLLQPLMVRVLETAFSESGDEALPGSGNRFARSVVVQCRVTPAGELLDLDAGGRGCGTSTGSRRQRGVAVRYADSMSTGDRETYLH